MPEALPGSKLPPPSLPVEVLENPDKLRRAVESLYPDLPKLAPGGIPVETTSAPMDLAALEAFAIENHPAVSQANADLQAAIGTMIQAGLYPNPSIGYEADTVNTGRTRGNQGVMLTQTIKTAGKLDLKKCSATMSLYNSQLAQSKTSVAARSQVRRAYFAVLVAQEQERVAEALAEFTHEVYRVQVDQLRAGQAAPYEPMQLRALAVQARGAILVARNRTDSARRQLAASLGSPNAAPPVAAGQVDRPGPRIEFEPAVAAALERHPDVLAARNSVSKARYDLRLAEVTPIPDVDIYSAIQKDFTTPPFGTTYNLQVSVPVPVFDRNQGAIRTACGLLVRASEEERRLQTTLTADFARAFERYRTSRELVDLYRDQIIPDQSRAYRGVYEHHQQEPAKVTFGDIVTAQQSLANSITTYLASLTEYWSAVVDLAELLQLEDVFATIPGAWEISVDVPPVPEGASTE
jgi:cobalt-zinc-cadmium efflux system outer membrane protein